MKKILILITSFILLISCDSLNIEDQSAEVLNLMKCPVVVLAKSNAQKDSVEGSYHSIVLIDSTGTAKEFSSKYHFGSAIYDTYNVRDTIKKCK